MENKQNDIFAQEYTTKNVIIQVLPLFLLIFTLNRAKINKNQ